MRILGGIAVLLVAVAVAGIAAVLGWIIVSDVVENYQLNSELHSRLTELRIYGLQFTGWQIHAFECVLLVIATSLFGAAHALLRSRLRGDFA